MQYLYKKYVPFQKDMELMIKSGKVFSKSMKMIMQSLSVVANI